MSPMERRTAIIELALPEGFPKQGDREEMLEAIRRATVIVKDRVTGQLEKLRALDPQLQISSKETIFPVLIVTSTDEVLDNISKSPDVKSVAPATDFKTL